MAKNSKRVLSGIRVLDFTDAMAGPFCARYLADCGCEVINIERPDGKIARYLPYSEKGYCAEYIQNHCGKKSLAMDLKAPGARDLIMKMAKVSDVVLENFRPGVMKDFGLSYDDFKEVNPSIIMCSISGWGQTGPEREFMGIDSVVQASRGLMYLSSGPEERPVFVSFAVSDILAGLNGFGAICAALFRRSVTGEGDYIDIGMGDCLLAALGNSIGAHILSNGKADFRYMQGSFSPDLSPAGVYKGKDGYIVIYARQDLGWQRIAELMGKPELGFDPRYATHADRIKNQKEVTRLIDDWVQTFDHVADVAALLQSYRIIAAPVLSVAHVVDEDAQTKARGMIVDMPHPALGDFKYLNTPLRFTNSKAQVEEPPPVAIGEHTDIILHNVLGLKPDEITNLKKDKIVFGPEK